MTQGLDGDIAMDRVSLGNASTRRVVGVKEYDT